MNTQEEAKIENNDTQMIRPHLKRVRNVVLGSSKPKLFSQIVFYIGFLTACIFGLWSTISYCILQFPLYLKAHKGVDVKAIIELRGRELGFTDVQFYGVLELFHLIGMCLWLLIGIAFLFFWRQKKWSIYVIIGCLILYVATMVVMLGPTYLIEDTTLFDKGTLVILILALLLHHFIVKVETNAPTSPLPFTDESTD